MKNITKILVMLVFCCITSNVFSQSIFRFVKPVKPVISRHIKVAGHLNINRVTIVETSKIESAVRAAEFQSRLRKQEELYRQSMVANQNRIPVAFLTQHIEQRVCKPEQLYGSYSYLRGCSKNMGGIDWVHINKVDTYNGVHHIINVQTLKELYKESLSSYEKGEIGLYPFFNEMVLNAPSAFHILHNNPKYSYVFHNSELQLEIYNKRGIKGILDAYFENIIRLNSELNLTPIPEDVIKGTYVEAELWSVYFGLDWEK